MTYVELIEHARDLSDLAANEGLHFAAFELRALIGKWEAAVAAIRPGAAHVAVIQSEICDAVDPTLSHRCGLHDGHDGQHAASDADRAIAVATWPRAGKNE